MEQGFDNRAGRLNFLGAVSEMIRTHQLEMHTALPGTIVAFDAATQTATVELNIQRELNGSNETLPQLESVPVMVACGGGFAVTFPLAAGDPCLILFIERGLDNWYLNGGTQPQATRRHHHYSDAVCLPGLKAAPDAIANYSATDLTIGREDGNGQLCITPAGQFAITNGTEELLTIIDELIQLVRTQQTLITGGSSAGLWQLQVADQTALQNLQNRLAALIK